ncbi:MAG: B12-binding domain-containing radical SAM protein [Theionarchaea archaeon]|nr:B12-binding domain-containing radical SAM protein [Theionarchaea archaeon]
MTGFSLSSFFQYPATREIISLIKKEHDTPIVCGGPFPIHQGRYLCEDGVDIVVRGEGELIFMDLVEALESGKHLNKIQGLVYRKGKTVIDTGFAPLPHLDSIPLPSYDELPLAEADYKQISCETSRGCPNNCSFCTVYPHRNWRGYPPEKALRAMEHAYEYVQYAQLPHVFLADSNFTVNAHRIKEMAEAPFDEIPSYCPVQLGHLNKDMVENLQKIGVKSVFIGVESVSQNTLASINKRINIDSVEKTCQLLLGYGIFPRLSFIFGLPHESKSSVISTLKYMRHLIAQFGEYMNIVVFPYHKDIATTSTEFENLKSLEKTTAFLMPDHHQKFRNWVTALVYLVNTYHNTLPPEEQIDKVDMVLKSSPQTVIDCARNYDEKKRPWLSGFQKYFQWMSNDL